MKYLGNIFRVEMAVTAFVAWQARDLLTAWRHSPYDHLGWLAFLLWLTPVVLAAWRRPETSSNKILVWAALAAALVGGISDVNLLNYAALALAVAGCWPLPGTKQLCWLALSLSWMPALGWIAVHARVPAVGMVVDTTRMVLGLLAVALGWRSFLRT